MNPERRAELLHLFNEVAPIARTFGMVLSYDDEGRATVDLPYNPDLDHALGGIHGGVYATLLDMAHDISCWVATTEMSVHFLAPVQRSTLRAVG